MYFYRNGFFLEIYIVFFSVHVAWRYDNNFQQLVPRYFVIDIELFTFENDLSDDDVSLSIIDRIGKMNKVLN